MDNFELQALTDVVKEGGDDVVEKFEKKFKDMKVEGLQPKAIDTLYI